MSFNSEKVYEIYKNRLLDISGRNKAISFKLTTKTVDLFEFVDFNIEDFLYNEESTLKISLKEYTNKKIHNKKLIEPNLSKLEKDTIYVEAKEDFVKIQNKILKILKDQETIYKETGRNLLYISSYFISGILHGDNNIKMYAPLFLIPIDVKIETNSIKLIKNEEDILINRVVLVALMKSKKIKFDINNFELNNFSKNIRDDLISKIKKEELMVELNETFVKFPIKVSNYIDPNKYVIYNNIILGCINLTNTIFNDYENLGKSSNLSIRNLLDDKTELNLKEQELENEYKNINLTNRELSLITKLDVSQELAVYMAKKSNNLVIYGPPGTGKSETILNIIANNLKENKKVLVVSEKKAAINVLYNRLMQLQAMSLMIDSDSFKLNNLKQMIKNHLSVNLTDNNEIDNSLDIIDNCLKYFNSIYEILNVEYKGKTISDWYKEPHKKISDFEEELEYKILINNHIKNIFNLDYDDFIKFLDNLNKLDTISIYKNLVTNLDSYKFMQILYEKRISSKDLIFELRSFKDNITKLNAINDKFETDKKFIIKKIEDLKKQDYELDKISYLINEINNIENLLKVLTKNKNTILINLSNYEPQSKQLLEQIKAIEEELTLKNKLKDELLANIEKQKAIVQENEKELSCLREKFMDLQNSSFISKLFHSNKINCLQYEIQQKNQELVNKTLYINQELVYNYNCLLDYIEQQEDSLLILQKQVAFYKNEISQLKIKIEEINNNINSKTKDLNENKEELQNLQQSIVTKNQKIENLQNELNILQSNVEEEFENIFNSFSLLKILNILDKYDYYAKHIDEIDNLISNTKIYNENIDNFRTLTLLNDNSLKLLEFMNQNNILNDSYKNLFLNIYIDIHMNEIDKLYGENLAQIEKYNIVMQDYKDNEADSFEKNIKNIIYSYSKYREKRKSLSTKISQKERPFFNELKSKKSNLKVRQFINAFWDIIINNFPIMLITPGAVSKYLPLIDNAFDVVIFDEASQLLIENAIPSIYRAKKVIVVGDDKQLKPSKFFKSNMGLEEELTIIEDEEYNDEDLLFMPDSLTQYSLLDIAKNKYNSVHLSFHYRSLYAELINFSNVVFYGGNLKLAPSILKQEQHKAIEKIKVNGNWIDNQNLEEATTTVKLLKNLLCNRKNNETIGIITFNAKQKDCIEECIEKERMIDSNFNTLYTKELSRVDNYEDKSIFVKNIENVQGDERDIIIFSVGYARGTNGKINTNFGPLSQDGGENRLNVAISRAKRKIYVITSFEPYELDVDNSKNEGSKIFKSYLEYVDFVSTNNQIGMESVLNNYRLQKNDISNKKFDSPFEEQVYIALTNLGYTVDTQVGCYGFKIDLAIYDEQLGRYILGIECDGATYHSGHNAKQRDISRQAFLESHGWNIFKIWSTNWWKNQNNVIKNLQNEIKKLRPI